MTKRKQLVGTISVFLLTGWPVASSAQLSSTETKAALLASPLQQQCIQQRLAEGYQPLSSVADLLAFGLSRNNFRGGSGGNAVLTNDIDLGNVPENVFSPFGTFPAPVNGQLGTKILDYDKHFDGCYHSISNLRARFAQRELAQMFADDATAYGLFAQIGGHGMVSNLTLTNFDFAFVPLNQSNYLNRLGFAGLLAGRSFGSVSNVRVRGGRLLCGVPYADGSWGGEHSATCGSVVGNLRAAETWSDYPGFVGKISNVYSSAEVISEYTAGGIVGLAEGPLRFVEFSGAVRAGDIAGGIVGRTAQFRPGRVVGTPAVRDSQMFGRVEAGPAPHPSGTGSEYAGTVGGIVGLARNYNGIVERTASFGLIRSLYTVSPGLGTVGGIIGYLEEGAGVRDSYSQSVIELSRTEQMAAGIIGYSAGSAVTISHVYFAGELPSRGGISFPIVGEFTSADLRGTDCLSSRTTNFFHLVSPSNQTFSASCGLALSSEQMTSSQTFLEAGWLAKVWSYPVGNYPQLR